MIEHTILDHGPYSFFEYKFDQIYIWVSNILLILTHLSFQYSRLFPVICVIKRKSFANGQYKDLNLFGLIDDVVSTKSCFNFICCFNSIAIFVYLFLSVFHHG
jgi:hypothetical protein